MQKALELLVSVGLPTAVVAMVLIALVFKKDHSRIATWAGWAAVALVAVFGIGQLVEIWRGKVQVEVVPKDASGFDSAGRPVDLEVRVRRGGRDLDSVTIPGMSQSLYEQRSLSAARSDSGLAVVFQQQPIGVLRRERLLDVGWHPATECGGAEIGDPKFWFTHRVYAGREHSLGATRYGMLKLRAIRFTQDGKAIVSLRLEGHETPIPMEIAIANKGLGIQSFADVPEFYIAVREADFTVDPPWAAFSVFSIH